MPDEKMESCRKSHYLEPDFDYIHGKQSFKEKQQQIYGDEVKKIPS